MIPNRRYRGKGIVVAMEDSREHGDFEDDYLIRRLIINAMETERDYGAGWDLVASIETEVCDIDEDKTDRGYLESGPEIYRVPFPQDPQLRKSIVRLCREHPQFFRTDTMFRSTFRCQSNPA